MLLLNKTTEKEKVCLNLHSPPTHTHTVEKHVTGRGDSHPPPSLIFKATNHPSSGERTETGTDRSTAASLCRRRTQHDYLPTCGTHLSLRGKVTLRG